ncbi:MAG: response regulator [Pseudomonadota bacterium]|nr:response regulator [Pseudomonadota bacterium]
MRCLILEDDELIAELLETVLFGLDSTASVVVARSVAEAQQRLASETFEVYLIDWNLSDGTGLEVIRRVRQTQPEVPVIMVSSRVDRESVLKAAHLGIQGYISKPLNVPLLRNRLAGFIERSADTPVELESFLPERLEAIEQLPVSLSADDLQSLADRLASISATQLAERWRDEPGLVARLMDVANRRALQRSGKPVEVLRDAIAELGVEMSISQALALALSNPPADWPDDLRSELEKTMAVAVETARVARQMAQQLRRSDDRIWEAGLLSRMGELAVLGALSEFVQSGGVLADGAMAQILERWSPAFGNAVKVRWNLPLGIRELIGAVHGLSRNNNPEEKRILRAAGLIANGEREGSECRRILDSLGLSGPERPALNATDML